MTDKIMFTLLDAVKPKVLAKKYHIKNGELRKETSAHLSKGRVSLRSVSDLEDFGKFLETINTSQALMYGVTKSGRNSEVITSRQLEESNSGPNTIARTKTFFKWREGPSIFMMDIDYDEGQASYTSDELIAELRTAIPELNSANMLHTHSSSSMIYDSEGKQLTGERGHRVYIAVKLGVDIPRLAEQIAIRLWASGRGYIKISKSGTMLERTTIDGSVYQENRIDFPAGAELGDGLQQCRSRPRIFNALDGESGLFDSENLVSDAPRDMVQRAEHAKKTARHLSEPEATQRRIQWKRQRALALGEFAADLELETNKTLDLALDKRILNKDFILEVQLKGRMDFDKISVGEILSETRRYDQALCRDPLEPDYRDGEPVGKLYLGGSPRLHSFARGGMTYKLARTRTIPGETYLATDETIRTMKESGQYYDLGDVLVTVVKGRPEALLSSAFSYQIAKIAQFTKPTRGVTGSQNIDPPPEIIKQILELRSTRDLLPLRGTSNLPIIRLDGSIQSQAGYDPHSQIYGDFDSDIFGEIPQYQTDSDYNQALEKLLSPFDEFEFANKESETALLAAIFTAIVRASLDKAPAFVVDASDPGAGKSMLCEAIGAIALGRRPATMAPLGEGREDETRKRVMSGLLPPAEPVFNIDNQNGRVDSPVLSQLLTSSAMTDRLLGQSKLASEIPNRVLILMSGNNIEFSEELSRRILKMTLRVNENGVFSRKYRNDVVKMILEERESFVVAGLTLLSAALCSQDSHEGPGIPSYSEWDRVVRRTVLWINRTLGKSYIDPLTIMQSAMATAPERQEIYPLLESLERTFGSDTFTASDILASSADDRLLEIQVKGLTGRTGPLSPQSVGIHLARLRGRKIGDLRLLHQVINHTGHYRLERVASVEATSLNLAGGN
ncbi:hypothetical protein ANTHELSMS3_02606 [Antarctobacter heliothermus]|uniref:Uncharacterized protein n=1 Tax=Antarctobacter heliothermus TaxID=74033 RepID=A0A222E5J7_9RHOB|nr:hypothetical protein [Antarctobacter heliothermus]ASP21268.1 hypothetical protein ANTHELSMS3_02606 [Antarctobacter heliothermus]